MTTEQVDDLTDQERAEQEASGALVGCDCPWCRELRLRDPDRMRYGAHDMADAWTQGYLAGIARATPSVVADPSP